MRLLTLFITLIGTASAIVIISEEVEATTVCHPSMNWCQGYAHVSTNTGGTSSARCFSLRTTNVLPTCTTSGITPVNEATWQMDAGQCVTFYFLTGTTGALPPAVPNKVSIQVINDAKTAAIRTYQVNAAIPVSGTSYSFCATSDGIAGSPSRAGTYSMFLEVIKDNGNGLPGNTNYNIDTNGQAAVGAITAFDTGALRGKLFVSSIANSAYPAGSTFAFGAAGDESATITATFTQPNAENSVETMRTFVADSATLLVGQVGATVDVDTTTLAQAYVIDQTFPFANGPYLAGLTIIGNAATTGLRWTVLADTGHGAGLTLSSDTNIYSTSTFNIDPRIVVDSDGIGTFATADEIIITKLDSSSGISVTQLNKGEVLYDEEYIFNARSELLSRAMTFSNEDESFVTCSGSASRTPVANKYSGTSTVTNPGVCTAINADPGSPRYIRLTATDQSYLSLMVFRVSTLYYVDTHIQISSTLNQDDFPTENANEDSVYIISLAETDTVHLWCHVKTVRKDTEVDTSGSAVSFNFIDPDLVTRLSGTDDTELDGWTTPSKDLLASTPLGTWTANCSVAFNGNTGAYTQQFMITVEGGGGGNNAMPGDPIKVSCTPTLAFVGQEVRCLIAETLLDGTGRLANAAGTNIDIRAPDETIVISNANPVEWQHGIYIYDFTPANGEGYYSIAVETIDAETMDSIPGIYALYVQSGIPISGNATINNTEVLNALDEHRERSFEFQMDSFLLLLAIAFFVVMAESKSDALYWFLATILSIYLLINRTDDSVIPIPIYVGWIFITLYQAVSLLMNARAPRVDGEN